MKELGIVAAMLLAELSDVTVSTVSKAARRRGMNDFVFVMYSNAFAASFLPPLTFVFYRKRNLPRLTYSIVGQLFVLGLLSCGGQLLYYFGIGYSSPTLASITSDLIPAFTFILAILFSMEKLDYKANSTRAKSFGTLVSVTGALIITLYKGLPIINNDPFAKLLAESLSSLQFDWVLGAALLAARSLLLSMAFIVQTWIIREYPAELIVVLIRCILVFILSVPASAISEKDPKGWRLRLDVELLAIGCSAVSALSFRSVLHIWAMVGKRGPVYVAMFKPLEIVFAVIMGIVFLGDSYLSWKGVSGSVFQVGVTAWCLHKTGPVSVSMFMPLRVIISMVVGGVLLSDAFYLGSFVVGAIIIVVGFYSVLWGKTKDIEVVWEALNQEANRPLF